MSRPSLTIHFEGLVEVIREAVREQLAELHRDAPAPLPHDKGWLTIAEAAAHARFTEATIRHWCNTGALRAEKVRGRWRLRLEVLDEFCRRGGHDTPRTVDVAKQAAAVVQRALSRKAVGA